jgi:hypothetical protein
MTPVAALHSKSGRFAPASRRARACARVANCTTRHVANLTSGSGSVPEEGEGNGITVLEIEDRTRPFGMPSMSGLALNGSRDCLGPSLFARAASIGL